MIMGTSVFLGIIFFSLSGALIPIRKIIIIRSSLLAPVSIYFLPSQTCNKQSDRLMRCKFSLMILMKLIRKCLLRFFSFSLFFLFQGTSSHETQYTYVDHTDARKEEARQRELRRLENDQRQKEFQEKLRQRAEEAERQAGQEKERRRARAEYQQQRQRNEK